LAKKPKNIHSKENLRASDCQYRSHNSPGFDPNLLRHKKACGAADEAVLKTQKITSYKRKSYFTGGIGSLGVGLRVIAHIRVTANNRIVPPGVYKIFEYSIRNSLTHTDPEARHYPTIKIND
jgi:hypothetical protein